MEKEERIIITNKKLYTPEEVVDEFSGYISHKNISLLIDHICVPELAECVISFTEQDGILFLNIGTGEFVSVVKREGT